MKKYANFIPESPVLYPSATKGIVGIDSVDAQIIQFDPEIIKKTPKEIQEIAEAIIECWFGGAKSIAIEIIENENIIEYIYGIKAIINYERITNIAGLQKYIQDSITAFDPSKICKNSI